MSGLMLEEEQVKTFNEMLSTILANNDRTDSDKLSAIHRCTELFNGLSDDSYAKALTGLVDTGHLITLLILAFEVFKNRTEAIDTRLILTRCCQFVHSINRMQSIYPFAFNHVLKMELKPSHAHQAINAYAFTQYLLSINGYTIKAKFHKALIAGLQLSQYPAEAEKTILIDIINDIDDKEDSLSQLISCSELTNHTKSSEHDDNLRFLVGIALGTLPSDWMSHLNENISEVCLPRLETTDYSNLFTSEMSNDLLKESYSHAASVVSAFSEINGSRRVRKTKTSQIIPIDSTLKPLNDFLTNFSSFLCKLVKKPDETDHELEFIASIMSAYRIMTYTLESTLDVFKKVPQISELILPQIIDCITMLPRLEMEQIQRIDQARQAVLIINEDAVSAYKDDTATILFMQYTTISCQRMTDENQLKLLRSTYETIFRMKCDPRLSKKLLLKKLHIFLNREAEFDKRIQLILTIILNNIQVLTEHKTLNPEHLKTLSSLSEAIFDGQTQIQDQQEKFQALYETEVAQSQSEIEKSIAKRLPKHLALEGSEEEPEEAESDSESEETKEDAPAVSAEFKLRSTIASPTLFKGLTITTARNLTTKIEGKIKTLFSKNRLEQLCLTADLKIKFASFSLKKHARKLNAHKITDETSALKKWFKEQLKHINLPEDDEELETVLDALKSRTDDIDALHELALSLQAEIDFQLERIKKSIDSKKPDTPTDAFHSLHLKQYQHNLVKVIQREAKTALPVGPRYTGAGAAAGAGTAPTTWHRHVSKMSLHNPIAADTTQAASKPPKRLTYSDNTMLQWAIDYSTSNQTTLPKAISAALIMAWRGTLTDIDIDANLLLQTYCEHITETCAYSIATILHRLANFIRNKVITERLRTDNLTPILVQMSKFPIDNQSTSNTVYALGLIAQADCLPTDFKVDLVFPLIRKLAEQAITRGQHISSPIYSLGLIAAAGYSNDSFPYRAIQSLVTKLIELDNFSSDPQQVSLTFYGLGLMAKEDCFCATTKFNHLEVLINTLSLKNAVPQNISNIFYGLGLIAQAGHLNIKLNSDSINILLEGLLEKKPSPKNISNTIYGLALLAEEGCLNNLLISNMLVKLVQQLPLISTNEQDISITAYAMLLLAHFDTIEHDTAKKLYNMLFQKISTGKIDRCNYSQLAAPNVYFKTGFTLPAGIIGDLEPRTSKLQKEVTKAANRVIGLKGQEEYIVEELNLPVDIYYDKHNLIVQVDGPVHDQIKKQKKDRLYGYILTEILDFRLIRISYHEWDKIKPGEIKKQEIIQAHLRRAGIPIKGEAAPLMPFCSDMTATDRTDETGEEEAKSPA